MSLVRIGVIGVGGISGVHLENLRQMEGVEIAALCDLSERVLSNRIEAFGGRGYADFHEMLEKEDLQGVLLCTPPKVRLEPIRACVDKRIPVFVEKPPSVTLEEGEEIRALLAESDHPHMVGFVFRWAEFVRPALEAIAGRQVYGIRSHYFADMMFPEARERCSPIYYDKSLSGGLIGDQALHILDLIRHATGAEARRISAFGNNLMCPKGPGINTEETVAIQLELETGVVASHLHTWAFPRWEIEMTLFGDNFDLTLHLSENRAEGQIDGKKAVFAQESQLHYPEMEAFIELVRTGDRALARSDYTDSLKTLALTQAVDRSVVTGEMVNL
ncbi:MAG: Myo-inositol 2-dehydrogenase [bacterium]|nr:Myo-inositol 2-dehydrogenase [bacterium]